MGKMRQAAERASASVRDRDAMRLACDEMDRLRDELRKRGGTVEVAIDLIREARNR